MQISLLTAVENADEAIKAADKLDTIPDDEDSNSASASSNKPRTSGETPPHRSPPPFHLPNLDSTTGKEAREKIRQSLEAKRQSMDKAERSLDLRRSLE